MSVRSIAERAAKDGYEVRFGGDLRADEDTRKLRGHAVVFNKRSLKLGWFYEIIAPEAVDRTLRDALDVRALVDHDTAKVLGRTKSGTLNLQKDRQGLKVAIDPPNTSYARDLMEVVERGDVSGMSYRFMVMPNGDEWDEDEDGNLIRTIVDMKIDEVSVVTFPAYPDTDITVAKRSFEVYAAAHPAKRTRKFLEQWHRTQLAR